MNFMDLSIVIPVHNERDNVATLADEIQAALGGKLDFEVIFVDDASTDDTFAVLQDLCAQKGPNWHVVRHERNAGQSAALLTGALAAQGAWIGTLDGDGQNDPADLWRFWTLVQQESDPPDMVIGHRVDRHDTWIRRLSSRIANAVRSALLHDGVPDSGCGVKLIRRELFLRLPYFDHFHRFLPALVRREGGRVVSMPVHHRPRRHGTSKYGIGNRLWVGLVDLFGVWWLLHRRRLPYPSRHGEQR